MLVRLAHLLHRTAPIAFGFPLLVLAGCAGPLSTLDPAGPAARDIATLWWIMLAASAAIAVGVGLLLVRAWASSPALVRFGPDRLVLWGGVAFPLAVLVALVAAALMLGERLLPGAAPLRVEATARQWAWDFAYPDGGATTGVLHIPAGRDVDVAVTSADVIHSLWVPRLAGKIDAIPGHVNLVRLHADAPGRYDGVCAEFCGIGHASMPFAVEAHPAESYPERLREAVE